MKAGSIASNSVVGNVSQKAFDKLNTMFDNKVGGSSMSQKVIEKVSSIIDGHIGGKSRSKSSKSKSKYGGSSCRADRGGFGSMLGSTMEAFQGNVRYMPGEMFAQPNASMTGLITSPNTKKVNSTASKMNSSMPKMNSAAMPKMNSSMTKMNSAAMPKMNSSFPKANTSVSTLKTTNSTTTGGAKKGNNNALIKKSSYPSKKKKSSKAKSLRK